MKKGKLIRAWIAVILAATVLTGCNGANVGGSDTETTNQGEQNSQADSQTQAVEVGSYDCSFTERDKDGSYDEEKATSVVFSENGVRIDGDGAVGEGTVVTVTAEGVYLISGKASQGQIRVECRDTDKVQLVLNGLELTDSSAPAILISSADKCFITAASGSKNTVSGSAQNQTDDDESVPNGAIYASCDLTLNGTGAVSVTGVGGHGVVSKDDLVLTQGEWSVKSDKVGLRGKDSIRIDGDVTLCVQAGTDGLRSDNDSNSDKGFIYLAGGNLTVTAEHDGIQAQTALISENAVLDITAGGGAENGRTHTDSFGGFSWSSSVSSSETETSCKGLKSGVLIRVTGGSILLDTADDAIHTNGIAELSGGVIALSSGDDGVHADSALTVSGGKITVKQSYEGLEATDIVIDGGEIEINATDDGINAAGGADASSQNGRFGQNMFSGSTGTLTINGGYLFVNAAGDGVDSNGTLTVTGGTTLVSGPTDSANGAVDYESSAVVTGGFFMALDSSGMAENFTQAENQGAILTSVGSQAANTSIAVTDSDGKVLISMISPKSFSNVTVSAPGMTVGGTYGFVVGGVVDGADSHGFMTDGTVSGGTTSGSVTLNDMIYGSGSGMGDMGGNRGGGFNPGGGDHGGGFNGQVPSDGFDEQTPSDRGDDKNLPDDLNGQTPPGGYDGQMPPDGFGQKGGKSDNGNAGQNQNLAPTA